MAARRPIVDNVWDLVVFDRNGQRVVTYTARGVAILEEMEHQTMRGNTCMLFKEHSAPTDGTSRDIEDYRRK